MGCGGSKSLPIEAGLGGGHHADAHTSMLKSHEQENQPSVPAPVKDAPITSPPKKAPSSNVVRSPTQNQGGDAAVAVALRSKRSGFILEGTSVQVDANYVKKVVPKDPAARELILQAMQHNITLKDFGEKNLQDMVDAMETRVVPAGTTIIEEGQPGDNCYVIESGKFDIIIGGNTVDTWGDGSPKNPCPRIVGELALAYNAPRAATVKAVTDARVWQIDRGTFRVVLANSSYASHQQTKAALKKGILEDLSDDQLDKVAAAATRIKKVKGDLIIKKGDAGEVFYIIEEGSVICKNLPGEQSNNVLHAGDYFGERALLKREPRVCDVYADSNCTLIAVAREDFESLLGHLRDLLEHNLGMRLLLCVPILSQLNDEDRSSLFSQLRLLSYKDKQTIMGQHTAVTQFFIIKEGSVAVTYTGDDHATKVPQTHLLKLGSHPNMKDLVNENGGPPMKQLGDLIAGQWFGETEIEAMSPATVAYQASGPVQCFVLDRQTYLNVLAPYIARTSAAKSRSRNGESKEADANDSKSSKGPDGSKSGRGATAAAEGKESERGASGGNKRSSTGGQESKTSDLTLRSPDAGHGSSGRHGASSSSGRHRAEPRKRLGIPFESLYKGPTLGTGTFGRVTLTFDERTYDKRSGRPKGDVYALKMLKKAQIIALKQQNNIMNERNILWRVDHPFIIKLYDTYNRKKELYMLMELVQGGELFARLQNSVTPGRVSPTEARFYASCVLDAFEHLHSMYIVYRDLKPENLLIDAEGYLKIVDFGFAKEVKDRTYTLCGTPEYLAPELVLGKGHDKGVDYWALGILLYEQVAGYSPFADSVNNDQMVICRNILKGDVEFPAHFKDKDLKDLILRLLVKDIPKRMGCQKGGAGDIKAHRFFRVLDFDDLREKRLQAPWRPELRDALDTSHFDEYPDDDEEEAPYRDDGSGWDKNF